MSGLGFLVVQSFLVRATMTQCAAVLSPAVLSLPQASLDSTGRVRQRLQCAPLTTKSAIDCPENGWKNERPCSDIAHANKLELEPKSAQDFKDAQKALSKATSVF